MTSRWKQIRYRIEWATMRAAAALVPRLPYGTLEPLAGALARIAFLVDSRGRGDAIDNLTVTVGAKRGYDDAEIRGIAQRSFAYFARAQLEAFWTRNLTKENYEDFMEVVFEDPSIEELAREKGAIWVTPHYGNFEWISIMFGYRGLPFKVVAQDFKNSLLTEVFAENREHSGHSVIPQTGAMLKLLRHLKNGGNAAFLTDLSLKPDKSSSIVRCFDLETCVTRLHAELAIRTGLPVIPAISVPKPGGRGYQMRFLTPLYANEEGDAEDLAQRCWDVLEPHILAFPEPWLWAYKHWRYRPRFPDRAYPRYAKRSWRFESRSLNLDPKSPPEYWKESLQGNPVEQPAPDDWEFSSDES